MQCRKCQASVAPNEALCPACGYPLNGGYLAGPNDDQTKSQRGDLERIKSEALLARQDAEAFLIRDLEAQVISPLAMGEIERLIIDPKGQDWQEHLSSFLTTNDASGLALEGVRLSELLEEGVDARSILRKGMLFLKNGRFSEAVEWWTLQRRHLERPDSKLSLLLLIMEVLAFVVAGQSDRAAQARAEMRAHPRFAQLQGRMGH